VDAAVQWTRGREMPSDESERLLVDAIDQVLGKAGAAVDKDAATELVKRAIELRRSIATWRWSLPSSAERRATMSQVLGLHVKLARLTRGDAR